MSACLESAIRFKNHGTWAQTDENRNDFWRDSSCYMCCVTCWCFIARKSLIITHTACKYCATLYIINVNEQKSNSAQRLKKIREMEKKCSFYFIIWVTIKYKKTKQCGRWFYNVERFFSIIFSLVIYYSGAWETYLLNIVNLLWIW